MTRERKRMVPPLDELYSLIESPFAAEKAERVGIGEDNRVVPVHLLETVAEAIEAAIDDQGRMMDQLASAISDPEKFRAEVKQLQDLIPTDTRRTEVVDE